jgi:hypothetical protein
MLHYSTLLGTFIPVFACTCLYFIQFFEQLKICKNKTEICSYQNKCATGILTTKVSVLIVYIIMDFLNEKTKAKIPRHVLALLLPRVQYADSLF